MNFLKTVLFALFCFVLFTQSCINAEPLTDLDNPLEYQNKKIKEEPDALIPAPLTKKEIKKLERDAKKLQKQNSKKKKPEKFKKNKRLKKRTYKSIKSEYKAPKTFAQYLVMAQDKKREDIIVPHADAKKDDKLVNLPDRELHVVKYNANPGFKELDLRQLMKSHELVTTGVLSPDGTKIAYSVVYSYPTSEQVASEMFYIDVQKYTQKADNSQNEQDGQNVQNDQNTENSDNPENTETTDNTDSQTVLENPENTEPQQEENIDVSSSKIKSILCNYHTIEAERTPFLKTGTEKLFQYEKKTFTIIDWSEDGQKIAVKEKIGSQTKGPWKTQVWTYDFENEQGYELTALREAIRYYWRTKYNLDLIDYMWDIFPLGWDLYNKDRIIVYAYAFGKNHQGAKFLGTWSIDYKNQRSELLSETKKDYYVSLNGFSLESVQY